MVTTVLDDKARKRSELEEAMKRFRRRIRKLNAELGTETNEKKEAPQKPVAQKPVAKTSTEEDDET